jgi:hypothetical protein
MQLLAVSPAEFFPALIYGSATIGHKTPSTLDQAVSV